MTVLSTGALAGVRLRITGADTAHVRRAAEVTEGHGALRVDDGADQVLVGIDLEVGAAGLATGAVAGVLAEAFVAARDALADLPAGGGLLLVVGTAGPADPCAGAVRALSRSLALESAARGVRVNALLVPVGTDAGEIVPLLLSPAALMVTGAVLDVA